LKILQISSAQSRGGGEQHLVDLAKGLAARGHVLHAALRPGSPVTDELREYGAKIWSLPLRNALDAASARRLARLVRQEQIQIVHAHLARDYPLAAYATRRRSAAKLIVTRHVLFPLNRLHRVVLSRAARVIAVSEAVARSLRAGPLALEQRIAVVPNGIDVERFELARARFDARSFRQRLEIPEDRLLVGSVGEITPLKGHEDFLRAAANIIRPVPRSYFLIAGVDTSAGGQHLSSLKTLISDLGLERNVKLLGWLDDLPSLYCALDVLVSASHTESFGLVIAEAMASGTPIVATQTEGAREILAPTDSGSLVGIGDVEALATAIIAKLENLELSRQAAATGPEIARRRLGVGRMVEETEQVYQAALAE
jgi:glycosyltransferase involved in cell wall biosynthesis